MTVIHRIGVRTVITGWRAWLIIVAAAVFIAVLECLVIGGAITFVLLLMLALPLVIGLALVMALLQSE